MTNKIIVASLVPSGVYGDEKENKNSKVNSLNNGNNEFRKNNGIKFFNSMNKNNYIYLGSTNNTVFNNMGVTLEEDGSLLLIRGEPKDLFTGMIQKYFNKGFKYDGFHIKEKDSKLMKFKGIYVDSNGDLIGIKRTDDNISGNKKEDNKLYQIKLDRIEYNYNFNKNILGDDSECIHIEYKEYIPKHTEKHDLSGVNNMVWRQEENILKFNRKNLDFTVRLVGGEILVSNLPAILMADVVDGVNAVDEVDARSKEYKLNIELNNNEKIESIKPIRNKIQVNISEGEKTRMHYVDTSLISSVEDYLYKNRKEGNKPPLSFYSLVGENNYNKYHSGQPFSSQSPSYFSSRHIPFFSSAIDNMRIRIDKAKQQRALKEYKTMVSDIAKSVDPGFRSFLSNIKELTNTSTSPCSNKYKALHNAKVNKERYFKSLNKHLKGINNRKTQGETFYSIIKDLKEKNSITITHANDARAFFGINAFSFAPKIKANAFLLASYSKTHSIILSKNENNRVKFSFINKKEANLSTGLSAGIGGYDKRWQKNSTDYGVTTPLMASAYLSLNYERKSNFSFEIGLDDVVDFIDKDLNFNLSTLENNTTLNDNKNISFGLLADARSEFSFDVNLELNNGTEVTIPRNAVGINMIASLLKLNININKFLDYGQIKVDEVDTLIELKSLEIFLDIYRDLRFLPSRTRSTHEVTWFPLATMKNFEFMIQKKINNLLNVNVFDSKKIKNKEEFEEDKKDLKGIYKRILKIDKLFDEHPITIDVNKNINKLDSIYLKMSSNKKSVEKITKDPFVENGEPDYLNSLNNKERKLQQFLLNLKQKKEILSSQEKKNMNESFKAYSVFKYKLNKRSEEIYKNTRGKFDDMMNNIKKNKDFSLKNIKNELDNLFNDCDKELNRMEYNLDSIDIMSVSEILDKVKSIPLVLLKLEHKEGIIHHQIKGEIKINYDTDDKTLDNISTVYYF
ncbi:hypothetical protein [Proteus terrae]|uniref:hypothetical protein n=1 Tax=Proteus terrae TaxID=1574161 RepID=UPI0034D3F7AD